MPWHRELFASASLFDRIARAVCRAGTLPRKELYEAWEIAKRVRRHFKGGRVVDLACGQGLLAHILLILDRDSVAAVAVDRKIPRNAGVLSDSLVCSWPFLEGRIQWKEADLATVEIFPGDLVVSAHACGSLTDQVLEMAGQAKSRVAVLPCCHNLKASSTGGLENWMDPCLAVDTVRALNLQRKGYWIKTAHIPCDITPKNRLLLGAPKGNGPTV